MSQPCADSGHCVVWEVAGVRYDSDKIPLNLMSFIWKISGSFDRQHRQPARYDS